MCVRACVRMVGYGLQQTISVLLVSNCFRLIPRMYGVQLVNQRGRGARPNAAGGMKPSLLLLLLLPLLVIPVEKNDWYAARKFRWNWMRQSRAERYGMSIEELLESAARLRWFGLVWMCVDKLKQCRFPVR